MEQCPNCGSDIRPTARFCTSCGYRVPERPAGTVGLEGRAQTDSNRSTGWSSSEESTESSENVYRQSEPEAPVPGSTVAETAGGAVTATDETSQSPSQEISDLGGVAVAKTDEGSTGPVVAVEESINDMAENRINIALFHVERLRQLVPDLSEWSEQQSDTVNKAIFTLEVALRGREMDSDPYESLRLNVAAAVKDPRDIDVMIALADRAEDIADLLSAHDQYSAGLRQALIDIKPAAVEYVAQTKHQAKKPSTRRRKRTTTTTPSPSDD